MNHNFATVTEDNRIVYAPDTLGKSLRAPSAWQYHNAGYWEIDATVPAAPEGQYAKATGLYDLVTVQEEHVPATNDDGEPLDPNDEYKPLLKVVRQRYEFLPIPEEVRPPRVFSKLYLRIALRKRGLEAAFDTLLDESGLRRMWDDANELNEAFQDFSDYLGEAQSALNLTDAEVEEILGEGEAVAR